MFSTKNIEIIYDKATKKGDYEKLKNLKESLSKDINGNLDLLMQMKCACSERVDVQSMASFAVGVMGILLSGISLCINDDNSILLLVQQYALVIIIVTGILFLQHGVT